MGFHLHTRILFWGALFGVLLLLPLAQPPVESVEAIEGPRRHVVKAGETLSSIATEYGIAIDELMTLNGITNPNRIVEGAVLKLPPGAGSSGQREYIVKPGDTLTSIAAAHGVPMTAILQLNTFDDPHRLKVGQSIVLPEGAGLTRPPAAATAAPAAKPAAKPSTSGAQAEIQQLIQTKAPAGARVGIVAVNLSSGERVEHRAWESFPAASVAKLAILVELERQVSVGALNLSDTLRNDVRNMIVLSDNPSANRLIQLLGSARINATMTQLGFKSTILRNQFEGPALPGFNGQLNQTSPGDMATLLTRITTEQLISPTSSRSMRDLMLATRDRSRLPRLLPADVRIAHKSGWYQGVSNDVGIVYTPTGRFIVSVFTAGATDPEAANQFIAHVAQTLHKTWSQRGT